LEIKQARHFAKTGIAPEILARGRSAQKNAGEARSIACTHKRKKRERLVSRVRILTNIANKKSVTKRNAYCRTFVKVDGKSPNLAVRNVAVGRRPGRFS
jgi:hypothetical protein